jgi:hypothetical protein
MTLLQETRKQFNGQIKTKKDLFEHIKRLTECSRCKRVYWDKLCPECAVKIQATRKGRIAKPPC